LQGTALAMVARDLSRAPSAQKEMAMEWPLQEKLLFKPKKMLQQKKKARDVASSKKDHCKMRKT